MGTGNLGIDTIKVELVVNSKINHIISNELYVFFILSRFMKFVLTERWRLTQDWIALIKYGNGLLNQH